MLPSKHRCLVVHTASFCILNLIRCTDSCVHHCNQETALQNVPQDTLVHSCTFRFMARCGNSSTWLPFMKPCIQETWRECTIHANTGTRVWFQEPMGKSMLCWHMLVALALGRQKQWTTGTCSRPILLLFLTVIPTWPAQANERFCLKKQGVQHVRKNAQGLLCCPHAHINLLPRLPRIQECNLQRLASSHGSECSIVYLGILPLEGLLDHS